MNLKLRILMFLIALPGGLLGGCAHDGVLCGGVTFKSTVDMERVHGPSSGSDSRSSTAYY